MSRPFIITIDGPAGVGKTTLTRRVAEAVGCAYLDTGAMFRALALELSPDLSHESGAPGGSDDPGDRMDKTPALRGDALTERLQRFSFALEGTGENTVLLCNGRPMGDAIRTEEVGAAAAKTAQIPEVRAFLKTAQQRLGAEFSLVAEGRDMGTVIFPDAACKIFLDARPEVRAQRRFLQLQEMGRPVDLPVLTEQIRRRDAEDRGRALAPLKPAPDARIIDASDLDIDGVFAAIMQVVSIAAQS